MTERRLPVRPDLDQLRRRAKELLRAIRRGDPDAVAALREHHPTPPDPAEARLHDAQLALARAYGAPSWPRVVRSCRLIDAIWQDDPDTIRDLVDQDPSLLHENAGIGNRNWGPPLVLSQPAYWANRRPEPDTAPFTRLVLEHGADPNVRASLRKRLHPGYGKDEVLREFRDVTPLSWGRRYHRQEFVSQEALRLIEGAGGRE